MVGRAGRAAALAGGVLVVWGAAPSRGASLDLSLEGPGGAPASAVSFGTSAPDTTWAASPVLLRAGVEGAGASWRLTIRSASSGGRGLRWSADTGVGVDLYWTRGETWAVLLDGGGATLGDGAGDAEIGVRFGADVGGAPAGAYEGVIALDLVVLGAPEESGPAWGRILAPHDGDRAALGAGRRLSVAAKADTAVDTAVVEWRYETGAVWTPIGEDRRGPIFAAVWDLTGAAAGTYVIRARGWRGGASAGASPSVGVVLVPPGSSADREEWEEEGRHVARVRTAGGAGVRLALGDGTRLEVPAGACAGATAWTAESRPAGAAEAASAARDGLTTVTAVRVFDVEGACAVFDAPVDVSLPYGETVPTSALGLYWFDEGIGRWVPVPDAIVETSAREVRGRVRHFTAFAVFAETFTSGLEAMRVYPNPYVPNDGLDENGRPWTPSDPSSGIVFDRLPSTTTIEIYDLTGRRVSTLTSGVSGGTSTRVTWDVRTDAGRDVSSGVYVAVVRGGGATVVRKIMVIR